ncbi:MAG TPA: RluA family pseudouridine synthase [Acidimicrobiales bacterium]|nr:RluA family pseudouridine synthase [Acidimicrobiales bacterium]
MRSPVPAALAGERLDRAVAILTGLPRTRVAELVADGAVRVGGQAVTSRSRRVAEGEELEVEAEVAGTRPALTEPDPTVAVSVVYADADVVVVDKPAGLVVHPGAGHTQGTLVQGLMARFPDLAERRPGDPSRPGVVHRLDKGTSGLLVVARTPEAYRALVLQMASRTVERRYLALVWGSVEASEGLVDAPVGRSDRDPTRMTVAAGGRPARTRYRVMGRYSAPAEATLVECALETGRTHQVRVHLSAIGHPLVGDARYRGSRRALRLDRPFLHAHFLAFDHPGKGDRTSFSSPLPEELEAVRRQLG